MGFLDDIWFYILDKILRISVRIFAWMDEVTGLDKKARGEDEGGGRDEH